MRITLFGAAGEVTGSSYLVETSRARVMVDFGLFQGGPSAEVKNRRVPAIEAGRLDAVVVTHAHLDHTGRLPLLSKLGFHGHIFATPASCELAFLVMEDTAEIQLSDSQRVYRHRQRKGRDKPLEPLYTMAHVQALRPMLKPVPCGQPTEVAPGISIKFFEAGHILGSASIEMTVSEPGSAPKIIVFSGDIGVKGTALLRDPTPPPNADLLFLESTYGDRDHKPLADTVREFREIIEHVAWQKEKLLIPAFAIGRTQSLIYALNDIQRKENLPHIPIYIDSPMAVAATEIYCKYRDLFDAETWALINSGDSPIKSPDVTLVRSGDESRKLNDLWGPGIIIAGSGMCTGGRILHHLRHNLWRHGVHVVIAGFQAEGSLGRRLVNGEKRVRIFGEWIDVRAHISTLGGFSAHAGQTELLAWADQISNTKPRIVLTHGEDPQRHTLAGKLKDRHGIEALLPTFEQVIEL